MKKPEEIFDDALHLLTDAPPSIAENYQDYFKIIQTKQSSITTFKLALTLIELCAKAKYQPAHAFLKQTEAYSQSSNSRSSPETFLTTFQRQFMAKVRKHATSLLNEINLAATKQSPKDQSEKELQFNLELH